jgi:hypothetical protein
LDNERLKISLLLCILQERNWDWNNNLLNFLYALYIISCMM